MAGEPASLPAEVDLLEKEIFEKKMALALLKTEREKIRALRALFPMHFRALSLASHSGHVLLCFRLAFLDWADFVSRFVKSEDIPIKDPEIELFRELLVELFDLSGEQKAVAHQLALSAETRKEVEEKYGHAGLIQALEALKDEQYSAYLDSLRAQGPIFEKIEELIEEAFEISNTPPADAEKSV